MEHMLVWVLLILVQQHGMHGMVFGTQQECDEVRVEARGNADVLALSECVLTTMKAREGGK